MLEDITTSLKIFLQKILKIFLKKNFSTKFDLCSRDMEINHNKTYENVEWKDDSLGRSICSAGMRT